MFFPVQYAVLHIALPRLPKTAYNVPFSLFLHALPLSAGPLVVNGDGTLSRIANWAEMSPIERERTVRILGKRNKLRLEKLKAEATQDQPADQEKGLTKDSEAQVPGSTTK
jgi:hypothetical protein